MLKSTLKPYMQAFPMQGKIECMLRSQQYPIFARENLDSSDGRVRDNVHEAGNREVHLDVRRGRVIWELGVDSISTPLVAIDGWREAAGDS
jgi:hypothetical protein